MDNIAKLYSFQKRINSEILKNNLQIPRTPDDKIECWGWEINYDAEIVYISPMIRNLLGYNPNEILFHSFNEFLSDEDLKNLQDQNIRQDFEKSDYFSFPAKIKKKNGSYIKIEVNGLGVFDENGNICGYEGIVIASKDDITKIRLS